MYGQIFIGVWWIIIGITHLLHNKLFLKKSIIHLLSEEELKKYQRGMALPFILLGTICITMGIIEKKEYLSIPMFILSYIVLVAIPLFLLLRNNKKHTDYYF